jgi:hypothetical protein
MCYTLGAYKFLLQLQQNPKLARLVNLLSVQYVFTFISQFDLVLLFLYLFYFNNNYFIII